MTRPGHLALFPVVCLICTLWGDPGVAEPASDIDHRIGVRVDARTTIVSPESGLKLSRSMLSMVRRPDRSILLCVQTQPVLLRSTDNGKTWTRIAIDLPGSSSDQIFHGLGVSRDGRVWLMHQTKGDGKDLYVSVSKEREGSEFTWTTTSIDYPALAPEKNKPYAFCLNDYNSFFQQDDGAMALGVGLRYENHGDYQQKDQTRPGFHETLIRSIDGGQTWGDPTKVHQHVAETSYAVDPQDPRHVLAFTRKQRMLLRGEEAETVAREADVPSDTVWPYKGAILLESNDGGRSFAEVADSYLGYYSHRGTMLWTKNNVIVAPHTAAGPSNYALVVNVSLDGGATWVNGTARGTRGMKRAKDFELVASPPGFSFTTPTVELAPNRFLTVYSQGYPHVTIKGVFWRIEAPTPKPIELGSERQLFIDDFIIESSDGVTKKLNQPTKHARNPLIARTPDDAPAWSAGMPTCFSTVVFDERDRVFKMWYSLHDGKGGDAQSVLCFATSVDGVRWFKPTLGIHEYRGTKKNNIVLPHGALASGVFIDPREEDPAKRFKMIHMRDEYKIYTSYSADGIRWLPYNDGNEVFFHPPGHDSQMVAYWDESLAKYVALIRDRTGRISNVRPRLVSDPKARTGWRKLWDPQNNRSPENHSIRRVAQIESDDFENWSNYRIIAGPDAEDPLNVDQFYNVEVMQYEGLRIGLMTVFSYDPNYCRGAVQLIHSRDGRDWIRTHNREVFIPLSNRVGDFDWGGIYPLQGPIVHNDRIWIFYNGYGVDHNHKRPPNLDGFPNGIALATLRLDGFVSVEATGDTFGTLTTKPFTFMGDKLVINSIERGGRFYVEFLDPAGSPIPGYTRSDCDRVRGDSLRHVVTWKGNADVSSLAGSEVKLRFHLKNTKLYSFSFPDGDPAGVDVEVGRRIQIVAPGKLTRAMMSIVRHPDGTIYLNTQTGPLYKSTDDGESWSPQPIDLPNVPPKQSIIGLGVTRGGRLLLVHQSPGHAPHDKRLYGQDLYVSYSDDGGQTWTQSQTDFRKFAPGIPNMKFHEDGTRTFVEQADGTLLFATTIVPAEDYKKAHPAADPPVGPNFQYGGTANDRFGDVIFRSRDGGITWGDRTCVYTSLNAHESALAIDPRNPNRILEIARIQHLVRPEEDALEMIRLTGNPQPYYKQGALFESVDGGRNFRLAPGGFTDWYGHRGGLLWTPRNVLVLTHNAGYRDSRVLARISLDGGRTWVNGSEDGTPLMTKSTKFTLAPEHSFISPTIELRKPNHFLTVYCVGRGFEVRGVFWRLRSE